MFFFKKQLLPFILILALTAGLCGCGITIQYADAAEEPAASQAPQITSVAANDAETSPSADLSSASPNPDVSEEPASEATSVVPEASEEPISSDSTEAVNLVAYDGIVEHLFFHPVIAYPELAFDGDSQEQGFDSYMVTVSEYNKMLQSMYDKGYVLVDMNDVWSEVVDEDGVHTMVRNTLQIPEGKKPLILSYDDTNYYNYMLNNGFTQKLVIKDGEIWSYGLDPDGSEVYSQDLDAITILDKFVKEHPDFSLNGAKGCLCLTGYEGILGYRTMTDTNGMTEEMEQLRQSEIEAVKPIVALLKETGWYFGSHTWGHIRLSTTSLQTVQSDTMRWLNEVGSLVGSTKLMIYPFGARPDGGDVFQTGEIFEYLYSKGFRVFASVGIESYSKIKSDICAVICDRMHADGDTLRKCRESYLKFYDAKLVFDYDYRPDYGTNW